MRKSYHFTIPGHERKNFKQVLKRLGLKEDTVVSTVDKHNVRQHDFVVAVSKYELLYIRLACEHGSYVDIEAFQKKQNKQLDQAAQKTQQMT